MVLEINTLNRILYNDTSHNHAICYIVSKINKFTISKKKILKYSVNNYKLQFIRYFVSWFYFKFM